MNRNQTITTGNIYFDAPTITPINRFLVSTATQKGSLVYNLKTTEPCTII